MKLTATQRRLLAILNEPDGFGSEAGAFVWGTSALTEPVRFNRDKTFEPLLYAKLVEFAPPDYRLFYATKGRRR